MEVNLLGIDIGGTKTSVCAGSEDGELRASRRMPTQTSASLDKYFAQVFALCDEVLRDASLRRDAVAAVGISAPGPMDNKAGMLISPPNNPGWHNVPVVDLVRKEFNLPVYMNNDANACALAEEYFGSHKGCLNLVYLTCSTGIGGGIILNGKLVQGVTDMGGEVGHQIVQMDGELCGCGMRGCLEAYVGGRNVAERLKRRIRAEKIQTAIVDKAGGKIDDIDFKALAEAAREGDPFALQEWDIFIERLAQGIGNLIMILNPAVIILGTIAVHQGDFLLSPLRERLRKYAWPWALEACQVVVTALGSRLADLGALAVARDGQASSEK